jgi:hypothetical protein
LTRAITIGGFVALISSAIALEMVARRPGSRVPSLGAMLSQVMRQRTGRVMVFIMWFWFGWHFLAR